MLELVAGGKLAELVEYLSIEITKLASAGSDLGLLAANTPHVVFDQLRIRSPIPLVSIVEAACQAASALGLRKVGLIGTRFTMQGRFYPEVFAREGIAVVIPGEDEQSFIHEKYMTELVAGRLLPETRESLLAIVDRLREKERIDGLILGGTELPLILREETYKGIPLLDTTKIHVECALSDGVLL